MQPHTNFSPEEGQALVLAGVEPGPVVDLPVPEALWRVLARPLTARIEDPRFNKSAVDGIGIRGDDSLQEFEILGQIAAGDGATFDLKRGQAVRIMTGAPVPADVGQVIKIENCRIEGSRARILEPERIPNIALRGENIKAGAPLVTPRRLLPQDIGVIASQGYETVPVFSAPRVAVIATGDEVYPAGTDLPPAGIYDSNSRQLTALARRAGAEVTNYGIVGDDSEAINAVVRDAVAGHQVVLISGGVSMGNRDYVPEVLLELGAEVVFHGLAMKPGRPTLYARIAGDNVGISNSTTHIFGLPGNPVSSFVQFEIMVRSLLCALEGTQYQPREIEAPLGSGFKRRVADRYEFRPGVFRAGMVEPLEYRGSGHISILAEAELLFRIDRGVYSLDRGSNVYVRFLR